MNTDLEEIAFTEVTDMQGKTYASYRKELLPDYNLVKRDIIAGYVCLLMILSAAIILKHFNIFYFPFLLIGGFLIGYCLGYLHLFIHEAAHYNIHPDRNINDKISDFSLGVFFGITVKNYRKIHWLHHQHLGTVSDTEHTYYNKLNILFLLKSITGLQAFNVIIDRAKTSTNNKTSGKNIFYMLYVFLFHTILLCALYFFSGWIVVIMWVVGLVCFFPFFAALRQLLEHRDKNAPDKIDFLQNDHGKINRLFGNNFFDKSFGAAGFNKHLIHHWDPVISYTRLKDVEIFLLNSPATSEKIQQYKTGYLKTFFSLFKFH